jgi:hypothetical protein
MKHKKTKKKKKKKKKKKNSYVKRIQQYTFFITFAYWQ